MRKLQILYQDPFCFNKKRDDIKLELQNIELIHIPNLIKHAARSKNDLGKQILTALSKGEFLSTKLIVQLIEQELIKANSNVLMVDFPKSKNEILELNILLDRLNINLHKIWYLKLDNLNFLNLEKYDLIFKDGKQEVIDRVLKEQHIIKEVMHIWGSIAPVQTILVNPEIDTNINSKIIKEINQL